MVYIIFFLLFYCHQKFVVFVRSWHLSARGGKPKRSKPIFHEDLSLWEENLFFPISLWCFRKDDLGDWEQVFASDKTLPFYHPFSHWFLPESQKFFSFKPAKNEAIAIFFLSFNDYFCSWQVSFWFYIINNFSSSQNTRSRLQDLNERASKAALKKVYGSISEKFSWFRKDQG